MRTHNTKRMFCNVFSLQQCTGPATLCVVCVCMPWCWRFNQWQWIDHSLLSRVKSKLNWWGGGVRQDLRCSASLSEAFCNIGTLPPKPCSSKTKSKTKIKSKSCQGLDDSCSHFSIVLTKTKTMMGYFLLQRKGHHHFVKKEGRLRATLHYMIAMADLIIHLTSHIKGIPCHRSLGGSLDHSLK